MGNLLSNEAIDYITSYKNATNFFMEKKGKSFSDAIDAFDVKIREFFSNIKTSVKKFIADMNIAIKRISLPMKLKKLKSEMLRNEKKGCKWVNMIDYDNFETVYHTYSQEIMERIKGFDFRKYKNKEKLDKKLDKLDNLIAEYKDSLDYVLEHPKKVSIDKAIRWVEKEINGESNLWKDYLRMTNELEHIMIGYDDLLRKSEVMTSQWLKNNHHIWIGRRAQDFMNFTKNKIVKCTRIVVFTFA